MMFTYFVAIPSLPNWCYSGHELWFSFSLQKRAFILLSVPNKDAESRVIYSNSPAQPSRAPRWSCELRVLLLPLAPTSPLDLPSEERSAPRWGLLDLVQPLPFRHGEGEGLSAADRNLNSQPGSEVVPSWGKGFCSCFTSLWALLPFLSHGLALTFFSLSVTRE